MLNKIKFISLIVLVILASYSKSYCQASRLLSANSFAMGQSALCFSLDADDIVDNPSNITNLQDLTISYTYSSQYEHGKNNCISIVFPLKRIGSFGILYSKYSFGNIPVTGLPNPNIPISSLNVPYIIKYIDDVTNNYYFTFGKKFHTDFAFGINGKFITKTIGDFDSDLSNIGVDVSMQYFPFKLNNLSNRMGIGIIFKNIIKPAINWNSRKEYLPRDINFIVENSVLFSQHSIKMVGNIDYYLKDDNVVSDKLGFHGGLEYGFMNTIFLRIGNYSDSIIYKDKGDNLISYGLGIKIKSVLFGYAFGDYGKEYEYIDPIHKFTFSLRL